MDYSHTKIAPVATTTPSFYTFPKQIDNRPYTCNGDTPSFNCR